MRRCDKCNCLCDPGDLVNGICDDCRETDRNQEENQEMLLRMMRGETRQMTMEDYVK